MRRILALTFLTAALNVPLNGHADPGTTGKGVMFCTDRDHLQEYFQALLKGDKQWIGQLRDCAVLRAGLKMVIIEDFSSDSDIGHVAKVRVFSTGSSFVGYALLIQGIND